MADVGKVILHAAVQAGIGIATGATIDAVMPPVPPLGYQHTTRGMAQLTAEVVAQLTLDALFASALSKGIKNLTRSGFDDPSGGFAFLLAVTSTQPQLLEKMALIGSGVRALIMGNDYNGDSSPGTHPGGYPESNHKVAPKSARKDQAARNGFYDARV